MTILIICGDRFLGTNGTSIVEFVREGEIEWPQLKDLADSVRNISCSKRNYDVRAVFRIVVVKL